MKILSTSILPVQQNKKQTSSQTSFRGSLEQDSFTRSIDSVDPKTAEKVLQNPAIMQNLSKFVSDGLTNTYLKLVELAYGSRSEKPAETNNTEEVDELRNEINELRERNRNLSDKLEQFSPENKISFKETNDEKEDVAEPVAQKVESVAAAEENPVSKEPVSDSTKYTRITFPKKRGVYSQAQKTLKTIVENTDVPTESADKLLAVCQKYAQKGCDTKEVVHVCDLLSKNRNDKEKLAQVIDDLYSDIDTSEPVTDDDVTDTEPVPEQAETVSTPETTVTTPTEPKKRISIELPEINLKPIGKIDLEKVDPKAKNKDRFGEKVKKTETTTEENTTRPRFQNTNVKAAKPKSPVKAASVDESKNFYKLPDPLPPYVRGIETQINEILKHFKKTVNPEYINPHICWLERDVLKEDIREFNVKQQIKDVKKFKNKEQYTNINEENAHEFVDALNSPKFKNLFTIHSAMRLIDRYVDFESDVPLTNQCNELVDCLKRTLYTALKSGVNFEIYEDTHSTKPSGKKRIYGPKITIPTEYMSARAKKLFRNKPIVVTFCEQRNGKDGYGAISTIFPQGEQ